MSRKIKLAFHNERKLSKAEIVLGNVLLQNVISNPNISGAELAEIMRLGQAEVRSVIKMIRENNSSFLNHTYLIATKKGYKVSNNPKELKTYFNKLQGMTHSKVKQLHELDLIMGDK